MLHSKREFLTTGEVAKLLHITRVSVYRWVKSQKIKAYRVPKGRYCIPKKDFMEFLKSSGMEKLIEDISISSKTTKILIVDDEPKIVETLKAFLEKANSNYHIVGTTSGFEAGRLVQSFIPDIIILDIVMPGVDGFEVCSKIKSDPLTKNIKVIAITGYVTKENMEKIKKEKVSAVFTKPFDYCELLKKIGELTG